MCLKLACLLLQLCLELGDVLINNRFFQCWWRDNRKRWWDHHLSSRNQHVMSQNDGKSKFKSYWNIHSNKHELFYKGLASRKVVRIYLRCHLRITYAATAPALSRNHNASLREAFLRSWNLKAVVSWTGRSWRGRAISSLEASWATWLSMSGLRATYAQLTPDLRGFSPTKDDSSTMSQDTILKSDFTPTRNHKKTMVCRHMISCKKSTYATTYAVCFPTTSSPPTYADLRISGFYLRARFLWPPPFLPQHGGFIAWLTWYIWHRHAGRFSLASCVVKMSWIWMFESHRKYENSVRTNL